MAKGFSLPGTMADLIQGFGNLWTGGDPTSWYPGRNVGNFMENWSNPDMRQGNIFDSVGQMISTPSPSQQAAEQSQWPFEGQHYETGRDMTSQFMGNPGQYQYDPSAWDYQGYQLGGGPGQGQPGQYGGGGGGGPQGGGVPAGGMDPRRSGLSGKDQRRASMFGDDEGGGGGGGGADAGAALSLIGAGADVAGGFLANEQNQNTYERALGGYGAGMQGLGGMRQDLTGRLLDQGMDQQNQQLGYWDQVMQDQAGGRQRMGQNLQGQLTAGQQGIAGQIGQNAQDLMYNYGRGAGGLMDQYGRQGGQAVNTLRQGGANIGAGYQDLQDQMNALYAGRTGGAMDLFNQGSQAGLGTMADRAQQVPGQYQTGLNNLTGAYGEAGDQFSGQAQQFGEQTGAAYDTAKQGALGNYQGQIGNLYGQGGLSDQMGANAQQQAGGFAAQTPGQYAGAMQNQTDFSGQQIGNVLGAYDQAGQQLGGMGQDYRQQAQGGYADLAQQLGGLGRQYGQEGAGAYNQAGAGVMGGAQRGTADVQTQYQQALGGRQGAWQGAADQLSGMAGQLGGKVQGQYDARTGQVMDMLGQNKGDVLGGFGQREQDVIGLAKQMGGDLAGGYGGLKSEQTGLLDQYGQQLQQGYGVRQADVTGQQGALNQQLGAGYEQRIQDYLGRMQGAGTQEKKDIGRQMDEAANKAQQDAISRGMTGTTVAGTTQRGYDTEKAQAQARVDERLQQQIAGMGAQLSGEAL